MSRLPAAALALLLPTAALAASRAEMEQRLHEGLALLSPTTLIVAMVVLGLVSVWMRYREMSPGLVWGVRGLSFTCGMLAVVMTLMSGFVTARDIERGKKTHQNTSGPCFVTAECSPGHACVSVQGDQRCRTLCAASKPCGAKQRCLQVASGESVCLDGPK